MLFAFGKVDSMAVFVSGDSCARSAAAADAGRVCGPEQTSGGGGEAAAPSLEPLCKSCETNDGLMEEISWCIRAQDCRCALCWRCAGSRGRRRAYECQAAVERNFTKSGRLMFWTFTAD